MGDKVTTFIAAYLVIAPMFFWVLYCIRKTGDQRRAMIFGIYARLNANRDAEADAFGSVSFDRHLWTMIWGGNPANLYRRVYPDWRF